MPAEADGKQQVTQLAEPLERWSGDSFDSPELLFNHETSLLAFHRRVLALSRDETVPLLERLRFLCISCTNLDEFFEVRVAAIRQRIRLGAVQPGADGLSPETTMAAIREQVLEMVAEQYQVLEQELLPGLSSRRRPVIVGGLAILEAMSNVLDIEAFETSDFALREGLLHDLLGRLDHADPRGFSVSGIAERLGCDADQAARVHDWVQAAFDQVAADWHLSDDHRDLLLWAAQLHEVGRAVNHHHHQKHGAYLLTHADMPGFTRPEQRFMAALIALQRGKVNPEAGDWAPQRMKLPVMRLSALLRMAVTLARPRSDLAMPDFSLAAGKNSLVLGLPPTWLDAHPLSARGLKHQQRQLRKLGLDLEITDMATVEVPSG